MGPGISSVFESTVEAEIEIFRLYYLFTDHLFNNILFINGFFNLMSFFKLNFASMIGKHSTRPTITGRRGFNVGKFGGYIE